VRSRKRTDLNAPLEEAVPSAINGITRERMDIKMIPAAPNNAAKGHSVAADCTDSLGMYLEAGQRLYAWQKKMTARGGKDNGLMVARAMQLTKFF
jgi:hypothetical protein